MRMDSKEALIRAIERATSEFAGLDEAQSSRIAGAAPLIVFACGSTALGLSSAARDLHGAPIRVISDAAEPGPRPVAPETGGLALGVSISGSSAEVGDFLRRRSEESVEVIYASRALAPGRGIARLGLDLGGIPRRYLPLAACLLLHRLRGSAFGALLPGALRATVGRPMAGLWAAIAAAYRSGLLPVFVSGDEPLLASVLSAQYMEFLKRPAFHLSFPSWTHDFLWSLAPADAERLMFLQFRPREDLADGRFSKACSRIESLGIQQVVLDPVQSRLGEYPASSLFAELLLLFHELAIGAGLDPGAEVSF